MGKKRPLRVTILCSSLIAALFLGGCSSTGHVEENEMEDENQTTVVNPSKNDQTEGTESGEITPDDGTSVTYLEGYTPGYFNAEVTNEAEQIADGVTMVANHVTKTNGNISVVYAIEIDLSKASVKAGTKDNLSFTCQFDKAVPYEQAQAWEDATGGTVYACINADFFGTKTVNAFVKDGFIVKESHNDNGSYDYTDTSSDVPASAPMLFGIKGDTAQIAPIISYEGDVTSASVKQELVQAKLTATYSVSAAGQTETVQAVLNSAPTSSAVSFITDTDSYYSLSDGGVALKVDISEGVENMTVLKKTAVTSSTRFKATSTEAYLLANARNKTGNAFLDSVEAGDTVTLHSEIQSPDGLWDGYTNILGCRQALVIDGQIASTVTLENTNGAQSTDVPRTAVGLKEDGTVVLFAVESLYYGGRASDDDTHGMSLPELAEFMYYYGCVQGANFDGGGSTQLIVKGESDSSARVVVRSSDTGSTELTDSRSVMNSFLITSRDDEE